MRIVRKGWGLPRSVTFFQRPKPPLGRKRAPVPFLDVPAGPKVGHTLIIGGPVGRLFVESVLSCGPTSKIFAVRAQTGTKGPLVLKWFDLRQTTRAAIAHEIAMQRRMAGRFAPKVVFGRTSLDVAYILMGRVGDDSLESQQSQAEMQRAKMAAKAQWAPLPPLPERHLLEVVHGLIAAIAHCHAHNVVHRDLKPENVMVSRARLGGHCEVSLVDFGLASPVLAEATPVGTITYMAPEALVGQSAQYAADIWAIGIITYRLLVGIEPYYAETEDEVRARLMADQPTFGLEELRLLMGQSQLGPSQRTALLFLCQRTLQKNPKDRPTAKELLAWPIWRALEL